MQVNYPDNVVQLATTQVVTPQGRPVITQVNSLVPRSCLLSPMPFDALRQ